MPPDARTFRSCPDKSTPRCNFRLWKVLRLVALVWLHNLVGLQLCVGVRRVDDELLGVVHDGESGEAVALAELARPTGANGKSTADVTGGVGFACWISLNFERARSRWRAVGVDGEGPSACSRCADTLPGGQMS